jgi:hypothetical protein
MIFIQNLSYYKCKKHLWCSSDNYSMLLTNISYHQLLSINPKKIINFVEKLKMLLTNFAFFFSVFSRLKMYFNYLTVCERLETPG